MTVLIVDDENLDLFISKRLLSAEFEAQGFTSLPDAFNWAKDNKFDVALIDYYLNDGALAPDVLKKLRELKGNSFKAIVLSSHVDDDQTKQLLEAGFSNIMLKPFSMEKFKECINHA